VPGSPANLTKQGLLAVQSMKVPQELILVLKNEGKKIFPRFAWNDHTSMHCLQQCAIHVPGQHQYPGFTTWYRIDHESMEDRCPYITSGCSLLKAWLVGKVFLAFTTHHKPASWKQVKSLYVGVATLVFQLYKF